MSLSRVSPDDPKHIEADRGCAKCFGPMTVVRTTPASLGLDMQTFECVTCGHVEKIKTDSMSAKWRASPLRHPK